MLKVNKKRFNVNVERRNEFTAGNYLANMLANEDVETQERNLKEQKIKAFEKGKGKGYPVTSKKQRYYILKQND